MPDGMISTIELPGLPYKLSRRYTNREESPYTRGMAIWLTSNLGYATDGRWDYRQWSAGDDSELGIAVWFFARDEDRTLFNMIWLS